MEFVRRRLREEIEQAIGDGYRFFISGFADGVDLEFAAIVAEFQQGNPPIYLEAAIPYRNRLKTSNRLFQKLIAECTGINIISEKYSADCYFARNRYLVKHSGRIIAVYDGREKSGTAQTMRMAAADNLELRVIDIEPEPETQE